MINSVNSSVHVPGSYNMTDCGRKMGCING